MSPELETLSKLIALGGNGAAIAGVYLLVKLFQRFEAIMERQARVIGALRDAYIATSPAAARVLNDFDRSENDRRLHELGP